MTAERIVHGHPRTVLYDGRFIATRGGAHPATIRLFDAGGVPAIRGIEVRIKLGGEACADIVAHSYDASSPVSLAHESYAVSRASRFDGTGDCAPQARYRIRPFLAGVRIDAHSAAQLPESFLFDELDARLVYGPVLWRLLAQAAGSPPVELGMIALDARVRDYGRAESAGTR